MSHQEQAAGGQLGPHDHFSRRLEPGDLRVERLLAELQHYKDKYANLTRELEGLQGSALYANKPPSSSTTPLPPPPSPPPLLSSLPSHHGPLPEPQPRRRVGDSYSTRTSSVNTMTHHPGPASSHLGPDHPPLPSSSSSSSARHRAWHDLIKRELQMTVILLQQREQDMERSNHLLKDRVAELTQELRHLKRRTAASPDPGEVRHVLKKLEESETRVRLAEEAAQALAEEVDLLQRRLVASPPAAAPPPVQPLPYPPEFMEDRQLPHYPHYHQQQGEPKANGSLEAPVDVHTSPSQLELVEKNEVLEKELQEAQERLKMSEEEYDALRARLEQERMEAEKQSCMLKQKLVQMKSTVQSHQEVAAQRAKKVDDLRTAMTTVEEENRRLEAQVKANEKEMDSQVESIKQLQEALELANQEKRRLQEQFQEQETLAMKQGEENSRLNREVQGLYADLSQTKAHLMTCESRLSVLEASTARDHAREHELLLARRQLREDRMRVEEAIIHELGRVAVSSYRAAWEEKEGKDDDDCQYGKRREEVT